MFSTTVVRDIVLSVLLLILTIADPESVGKLSLSPLPSDMDL